jgi:hypothetical protein
VRSRFRKSNLAEISFHGWPDRVLTGESSDENLLNFLIVPPSSSARNPTLFLERRSAGSGLLRFGATVSRGGHQTNQQNRDTRHRDSRLGVATVSDDADTIYKKTRRSHMNLNSRGNQWSGVGRGVRELRTELCEDGRKDQIISIKHPTPEAPTRVHSLPHRQLRCSAPRQQHPPPDSYTARC